MMDQLSNGAKELTSKSGFERSTLDPGVSTCALTGQGKGVENGVPFENVKFGNDFVKTVSKAEDSARSRGNRGGDLPKMPLKLLPNFGEDPCRRLRKWNKAAERKLEKDKDVISSELKAKTSRIDKGIRNMEEELKDLDQEKTYNEKRSSLTCLCHQEDYSDLKFPAIATSRRQTSRRQASGPRCSYSKVKPKQKCHHFPCVRPRTYHTIGYRGNPGFTTWMSWEDIKESWNDPDLVDHVSTSTHDVNVSPRMVTMRKEERLRRVIERRKYENDLKRPQSWATNYGEPMSFKQLKYPVRLNPITD